jgi:hypothetical protein
MALDIDGRTELLDGIIYDVAARNPPHRFALNRLARHLQLALPELTVQQQDAVAIPDWKGRNAPEPDIAVTDEPARPAAANVRAIVEVSDTTYRRDREKVKLYVEAAIPAWIVNIRERRVEVYASAGDLALPHGRAFHIGESFSMLGVLVEVASLFEDTQ